MPGCPCRERALKSGSIHIPQAWSAPAATQLHTRLRHAWGQHRSPSSGSGQPFRGSGTCCDGVARAHAHGAPGAGIQPSPRRHHRLQHHPRIVPGGTHQGDRQQAAAAGVKSSCVTLQRWQRQCSPARQPPGPSPRNACIPCRSPGTSARSTLTPATEAGMRQHQRQRSHGVGPLADHNRRLLLRQQLPPQHSQSC